MGVLLDVAELWELYVLAVLKRVWPSMDVTHGTRDSAMHALLINAHRKPLGRLKPDALVGRGGSIAVIADAKYKRLWPNPWNDAPQREDMYQLAAYLERFGDQGGSIQGMLLYPFDPSNPSIPPAEAGNPWMLDSRKRVRFLTLPHQIDEAVRKLAEAVPHPIG